jgi:rod shape-determining protein MreD
MIDIIQRNIIRFFVLALVQVLIFNNINMGGYLNPYIYVLFIILMPFETPKIFLLISAFFLGFLVDIFTNTIGLHSAASVLMAFVRPRILQLSAPRDGYEVRTFPRVHYYGLLWFIKYSIVLIAIHHVFFFFLEAFSLDNFFLTLYRAFLNILFTTFLVVFSQFLVYRK